MERQASTRLSVVRPNGIIGAIQQAEHCSIWVEGYAARSRCCKRRLAIVMGLKFSWAWNCHGLEHVAPCENLGDASGAGVGGHHVAAALVAAGVKAMADEGQG